jgi:hypothetical protein
MKYFFGFLASIALIVLVFFLVLRGLTGGGDEAANESTRRLTSFASTSTAMRLTVDGPIIANVIHNSYQITVDRNQSTMDTYRGYDQQELLATQSYSNNEEGYRQFLAALDLAGYTLGDTEGKPRRPEGVCANDRRMLVEIINGPRVLQSYWTTSCDEEEGTFRGNIVAVNRLFHAQIPDYSKLTQGLKL